VGNILFRVGKAFSDNLTNVGVINISVNTRGSLGNRGRDRSLFSRSSLGFNRCGSIFGSCDSFINISIQDSSVRASSSNRVDSNASSISSHSGDRRSKYSFSSSSYGSSRLVSRRDRGRCGFSLYGCGRWSRLGSLRRPVFKSSNIFFVFNENSKSLTERDILFSSRE